MELSSNEATVLSWILKHYAGTRIEERSLKIPGLGVREIASAVSYLEKKGLIDSVYEQESTYELGPEGLRFLKEGLPEKRLIKLLENHSKIAIETVFKFMGEDGRIAITQLSQLGVKPNQGILVFPTDKIGVIGKEIDEREKILYRISEGSTPTEDEILKFRKRGTVLVERKTGTRLLSPTDRAGAEILSNSTEKIDTVTPELIASGKWKGSGFRKYDLNSPVERVEAGFVHPVSLLIQKVRAIFLEMGFTEMKGHYIEYSGWNMDALFIPQDHPARDMQDTFYLDSTSEFTFEHPEAMKIISKTHERGIPGYSGWGYKWNITESQKLLLRTHTTVSTIRYLYEHRDSPQAIFSVDKVFRHESVDWKHLAELHQIEGAVCSKNANISTLKWLIREFYERLGFSRIRFIPSYYPYTEPSLDTIAEINGQEVELGGSGVFRPEVTRPLGIRDPVIAWGLGLERLAMLYYGLDDIRKIYQSDIEWLRTFKVRV
ncbi:MAG: phenylalanine--tRNA ligase subunit alpha [Thermoplasmataceae archaeon]